MGMLSPLLERWLARHRAAYFQSTASDAAAGLLAISKAFRLALQTAVLGTGAWLAIRNEISPGMMIAASIIMGRALSPVEQAVANWKGFAKARTAFDRLQTILRALPAETVHMPLPRPQGHVAFQNVAVTPPGSTRPVLRGVSFDLPAGHTLAVIGPSAAGKSTLVRALVGVWQPSQGTIRLDGDDLKTWNQDELGLTLGYVPQDVSCLTAPLPKTLPVLLLWTHRT